MEQKALAPLVDAVYPKVCERLDGLVASCKDVIEIDDSWRSFHTGDEHEGIGDAADDFARNAAPYYRIREAYFSAGHVHVRHGDHYELWENKSLPVIQLKYAALEGQDEDFRREKRLFQIGGNHDAELKLPKAMLLRYRPTGQTILLNHGNPGDLLNDAWWPVGRFFTRYVWRALQRIGLHDPTVYKLKKHDIQEEALKRWCAERRQVAIFAHTHMLAGSAVPVRLTDLFRDGPFYWNTGSWVGVGGEAVQIEDGKAVMRAFTNSKRGTL
ncbi:MAG: hypothetical protein EHM36_00185 [Deltaproteobacteria bacterium]|nr:MAG: hypothetical protein EHM36_00185 [Deltaproteobacteria bacterium]